MAAESLTRRAFGYQTQFWKSWSKPLVNSYTILGQTVAGYVVVTFNMAYIILFYAIGSRIFGWWNPSDILFDPNILATYLPWFTSLARSLGAGFWEECIFRAVPLSCAALLGQRIGYRKTAIGVAFIAQAIIFGAAHANYPAFPSYVRLIELIVPSFLFGGIYLGWGLLPAIISHTTYDIIWFALPLFVSTAPGIWLDKTFVIVGALIPLLVVIFNSYKSGLQRAPETVLNKAWRPTQTTEPFSEELQNFVPVSLSKKITSIVFASGMLGCLLWIFCTPFKQEAPSLKLTRTQAIKTALAALQEREVTIQPPWQTVATLEANPPEASRYVWQKAGAKIYNELLGTYLSTPEWHVRCVQFTGDLVERAEEYHVFINAFGDVQRIMHQLPESRAGKTLTQQEARTITYNYIQKNYALTEQQLQEISAVAAKLPARVDWTFEFENQELSNKLEMLKVRIHIGIAGDIVSDAYRYIYVPEEWSRTERNYASLVSTINTMCSLLVMLLILCAAFVALHSWSKKRFNKNIFLLVCTFWMLLFILQFCNSWPLIKATFNTTETVGVQTLSILIFTFIKMLFRALSIALVLGYIHKKFISTSFTTTTRTWLLGISLGVCYSGLNALVTFLAPKTAPFWLDSLAAGTYLPFLGLRFVDLSTFIIQVTGFIVIIMLLNYLNMRKSTIGIFITIFLMSCAFTPLTPIITLTIWLLRSTLTALFLYVSYYYVIRYDRSIAPVVIATPLVLAALQQAIINPYPGAIINSVFFIAIITLLASVWSQQLSKRALHN